LGVRRTLAGIALVVLACSPAVRRGNTVILASGADLQSPNPLLTVHPLARQVQRYALLVTLVRYDSLLQPIPYLAREWRWSSDSTVLTMRIFNGLRWHDGAPTTARDAGWTLEAAQDPASGYPRRNDLAAIAAVMTPDDSTLVLRFSEPQHRVPDVLTDLAILPQHLLGAAPHAELRKAEWNQRPVGNGPFRFVAHEPNRRWVFEANPDFPAALGGRPRLDRFVIAVVDEPTTKLAALTSGELDFAGINPAHAEFVRRDPRLIVLDYPLLFSYALVLNLRRPPFDRLVARQAVAVAIDRAAIVDGVLFGFGTPATGPLPPQLTAPGPDALPSPAAASKAGIESPATDGALHAGLSSPLDFEMLTVGSGEAALEQMLQAQLASAGIRAWIRQLELSTYLDRVQGPSHEFDAAVMGISGDLALGHLARLVTLSGLRAQGGGERLVRLIQDSVPAVFLYHARGVQGMNRRVHGVRMDLRGELVTLSQWWVE
jgi:peptide/nickel transport system substrate-binding protein